MEAFSTEVPKRGQVETDRRFLALMLNDPQYRLRWLGRGQNLAEPISEFLAARFDLGADPFRRELPAQLVIQTRRHAYVRWVEDGNFRRLKSGLRFGIETTLHHCRADPSACDRSADFSRDQVYLVSSTQLRE